MAKRYIRVNWQNKPSTSTPMSATNFNKMDKGIDDLDNAIEDIYGKMFDKTNIIQNGTTNDASKVSSSAVTYQQGLTIANKIDKANISNNLVTTEADMVLDARQGKILNDGITTINNNLADITTAGNTVANTATTIPIPLIGHIYILAFASSNPSYFGLYFAVRSDSSTINLVPIKAPANITVSTNATGIVATSTSYTIPYKLTDITRFMN